MDESAPVTIREGIRLSLEEKVASGTASSEADSSSRIRLLESSFSIISPISSAGRLGRGMKPEHISKNVTLLQLPHSRPTSHHRSPLVHSDENLKTPNPSVLPPTYASQDCNEYTLHAAANHVHREFDAPKTVFAKPLVPSC
jgi:hypothetical protein